MSEIKLNQSFKLSVSLFIILATVILIPEFTLASTFSWIIFFFIFLTYCFFVIKLINVIFQKLTKNRPILIESKKLWLLIASTLFTLVSIEIFLRWQSTQKTTLVSIEDEHITVPEEFKKREVSIPGANHAFYWWGKLHVVNEHGMRHSSPFPEKNENVFRIITVGDSLTYGQGVGNEETYSSVLESHLRKEFKVEIINLGICGIQSEQVREVIEKFVPKLNPNLVIYGVCINDFLPTGQGQYKNNNRFLVPISPKLKEFLISNFKIFEFFSERYNTILIKLKIRRGFIQDILVDFGGYQKRFKTDLKQMNEFVLKETQTPILSSVFYPAPNNQKGVEVALIAENIIKESGMSLVSMKKFFEDYKDKNFRISRWEGHPNPEVHQIFAQHLERAIRKTNLLDEFKLN